jgi:hypothetical protein
MVVCILEDPIAWLSNFATLLSETINRIKELEDLVKNDSAIIPSL